MLDITTVFPLETVSSANVLWIKTYTTDLFQDRDRQGVFYGWIRGAEIGRFGPIFVMFWLLIKAYAPYILVHFLSRFGLISGGSKIDVKRAEIRQ